MGAAGLAKRAFAELFGTVSVCCLHSSVLLVPLVLCWGERPRLLFPWALPTRPFELARAEGTFKLLPPAANVDLLVIPTGGRAVRCAEDPLDMLFSYSALKFLASLSSSFLSPSFHFLTSTEYSGSSIAIFAFKSDC